VAEHDEQNVHQVWSDDELDQALSTLHSEIGTDERVLSRTRAELIVAAGGQPQPAQPSTADTTRGRHWGRWAAAAAVVVLVAGALVIQTVSFGGKPPAASAAAAALNSAADKIGASDPPLRPGQYRYISSHAWSMTTFAGSSGEKSFSYLEEHLAEEWVPADQTQEWLLRSHPTGNRKWIDGSEEEARAAGLPVDETTRPADELRARCGDYYPDQGKQPCERAGGWQGPTPEFLASLPTDPRELYERLRVDTADRGPDPDLEMLVYAADALRSGRVPANVRANLYRALSYVPALEITDRAANLDGQVGMALGVSRAGHQQEMIIDPNTGQFIGERDITVAGFQGVPPGTVTGYSSMSTAVVDKIGDRPAG
jgi:hypothetical protein